MVFSSCHYLDEPLVVDIAMIGIYGIGMVDNRFGGDSVHPQE